MSLHFTAKFDIMKRITRVSSKGYVGTRTKRWRQATYDFVRHKARTRTAVQVTVLGKVADQDYGN